MNERPDVSAVISTYNRCEMLGVALERLLAQQSAGRELRGDSRRQQLDRHRPGRSSSR